jgi:hypothetical protein
MTRRILLYSAACILLIVTSTFTAVQGGQVASPAVGNDLAAELKDKIVLLEVNRSSVLETKSGTMLLQMVRITKLGNRDFLVGVGYSPEDDNNYWYKDMLVGVPCESILRFNAMTPAQCAQFMKQWKEQVEE